MPSDEQLWQLPGNCQCFYIVYGDMARYTILCINAIRYRWQKLLNYHVCAKVIKDNVPQLMEYTEYANEEFSNDLDGRFLGGTFSLTTLLAWLKR